MYIFAPIWEIPNPALCRAMLANDENYSSEVLQSLALDDARKGGLGRANGMLVVSMQRVRNAYLALSPDKRSHPLPFGNTILDANVSAVLEGISVSKYRMV